VSTLSIVIRSPKRFLLLLCFLLLTFCEIPAALVHGGISAPVFRFVVSFSLIVYVLERERVCVCTCGMCALCLCLGVLCCVNVLSVHR
jgi:hypothetical protein